MRLGTILLWTPGERSRFESRVRLAEELGYDLIGVGDSPSVYRDWSLSLGLASQITRSAQVGTLVASPHGRHPVATVNALSAINEWSNGRAFYGVGTGGSAASATGARASTLAELRHYIEALRALMAGDNALYSDRVVPSMSGVSRAPIMVSAYGPAAMRLAGELGDSVILAVGASPDLIAEYIGYVAEGAVASGRSISEIPIWVMARVAVGATRAEAIGQVAANLASGAAFGLRPKAQMASVPVDLRPAIEELQRRYDQAAHVVWGGTNAAMIEELGVGEYLARRFGVIGTAAECHAQVSEMRAIGVHGIIAPAVDRDPEGILRNFASIVAGDGESSQADGGDSSSG